MRMENQKLDLQVKPENCLFNFYLACFRNTSKVTYKYERSNMKLSSSNPIATVQDMLHHCNGEPRICVEKTIEYVITHQGEYQKPKPQVFGRMFLVR